MAGMQNVHEIQRLWRNCCSVRRVPIIHAILKNYKKYRQHGTGPNRNKQWEIPLAFSHIVIKGEIKVKELWFQSTTSFCPVQLKGQSMFVRF